MKRIGAEEMLKLDASAIWDHGISGRVLMENAGRGVADVIFREFPRCKVVIFIGKGNNGGDGLVVARYLAERFYAVEIVLLEEVRLLKTDSLANLQVLQCRSLPGSLNALTDASAFQAKCCEADLVVDAIFGIGLHRPASGVFSDAIRAISQSGKPVVSIDIPSGLDADTGAVHGVAVIATRTVTLALPKRGLFLGEGPRHAGTIDLIDIGHPRELLEPFLD